MAEGKKRKLTKDEKKELRRFIAAIDRLDTMLQKLETDFDDPEVVAWAAQQSPETLAVLAPARYAREKMAVVRAQLAAHDKPVKH